MAEVGNLLLQASYLVCANSLRREAKLCDIILYVQGRMGAMVGYPAHKLLLISSSKYFKLLFEREELRSYCHFPHLTEEGVFAVLDIIYGREIRQETNLDDALMAARFLQVDCAVEQLEKRKEDLKARESPPPKRKRTPSGGKSRTSQPGSPSHRPAEMRVFKNMKLAKEEDYDVGESDASNTGYREGELDSPYSHSSTYHDASTGQDQDMTSDQNVTVKMEPDVDLTAEDSDQGLPPSDVPHGSLSFSGQGFGQGDGSGGMYGGDMSSSSMNPMASSSYSDPSFQTGQFSGANMDNGQSFKFQCDICGKEFASAEFLDEHRASHAGSYVQCRICRKTYSSVALLRQHMGTHGATKPFTCEVCGRGFSCAANKSKHMVVHTGERKYNCDICGRAFTQSSNVNQHKRTVHGV